MQSSLTGDQPYKECSLISNYGPNGNQVMRHDVISSDQTFEIFASHLHFQPKILVSGRLRIFDQKLSENFF